MAQLDFQQVHDLGDNFFAMAKAVGAYRYNNPSIPDEQDHKLDESQKAIIKYANKLYTISAIIIIADEDVTNSLSTISDITAQIKETYAKLQMVQKAIDVATSIVALGAALFSKDPAAVGKSINDLVNKWKKSIPAVRAKRISKIKPKKKI